MVYVKKKVFSYFTSYTITDKLKTNIKGKMFKFSLENLDSNFSHLELGKDIFLIKLQNIND